MYPVFPPVVVDDIQKGFKREKALAVIVALNEVYKTTLHSQNKELQKKIEDKISVLVDEI